MDYKWFVFIAIAGAFLTVTLAAWKLVSPTWRSYGDNHLGGESRTWSSRLSWFAVPWPLFIAITILGWRYIYTVILWHQ